MSGRRDRAIRIGQLRHRAETWLWRHPSTARRLLLSDLRVLDEQRRSPAPRLARHESRRFSQHGEDGILRYLFDQLGVDVGTFVEVGAADGEQNCTRSLAEDGWRGLWLEGDPELVDASRRLAIADRVVIRRAMVDVDNVEALIDEAELGGDPDLLVIDIDGNDHWVLQQVLRSKRPLVLCVEYNGEHRWSWSTPYRPVRSWDRSWDYGVSLMVLDSLLSEHGYSLVGCDSTGVNAFFVRDDVRPASLPAGSAPDLEVAPSHRPGTLGHPRSSPLGPPTPPLSPAELSLVALRDATVVGSADRLTGEVVNVVVDVVNGSDRELTSTGDQPILLTYRLLAADRSVLDDGDGLRAPLSSIVAPGATRPSALEVRLPAEAGDHLVVPTIVQEHHQWRTPVAAEGVRLSCAAPGPAPSDGAGAS